MKQFFLTVLLAVFCVQSFAQDERLCPPVHGGIQGGDSRPWPWGNELSFPWEEMSGIWQASPNCSTYFVINVKKEFRKETDVPKSDRFFINISQLDGSCRQVAHGKGFGNAGTDVASAAMVGDFSYNLTIRVLKSEDVSKGGQGKLTSSFYPQYGRGAALPSPHQLASPVVKLTMFPAGDWDGGKTYSLKQIPSHRFHCKID